MPDLANQIEMPYRASSEAYFDALEPLGKRAWLDSGKPNSDYGRYDILTAAPSEVLTTPSAKTLSEKHQQLKAEQNSASLDKLDLPFVGGLIGYFNYEYRHEAFAIERKRLQVPSLVGVYHWALVQDHKKKTSYLIFLDSIDQQKRKDIQALVTTSLSNSDKIDSQIEASFRVKNLHADQNFDEYQKSFDQIQRHISEGDCYQINFSQQFSGAFSGSPSSAYKTLRNTTPTPFSAFLDIGEESILSLSPERFIEINQATAKTSPIKGTAPRDKNPEKDRALAEGLKNSEKNRAENVMIVDLLRNDFSQSCKTHSVKVPKLFELESFANVHHLVSTVEGTLQDHISPIEFFIRCFPGGSITGAPKKRAMEIINQLEAHPRNIYCGSIWYWSLNDRFDSNIAIRTLYVSSDKIYCCGGGGIVADSSADEEYQESIQKVALLLECLTR